MSHARAMNVLPGTPVQWVRDKLGYEFRDPVLLEAAFTHRSATGPHNERLEFLGDAVLNCVVAMIIYSAFPACDEGELSRFRASLVSGESLALIAADLGLGDKLRLGSGELKSGGFRRKSILADALEAIFGAIYLDGGFAAVEETIRQLVQLRLKDLPSAAELKDPKTRLQEALQARGLNLPLYAVERIAGEAHNQVFRMRCSVQSLNLNSFGEGLSRRRAEQEAARELLEQLTMLWGSKA